MTDTISQSYPLDPKHLEGVLFRQNSEPMWIYCTATLAFLAVNEAAVRNYGYTDAEFLTMTLSDIHPMEDISSLEHHGSEMPQRSLGSGVWRHQTRNRHVFWAEMFSHAVTYHGLSARLVTARDISEQRRTEMELRHTQEQYQSIVENAVDGIFQTTTDGYYRRANPALARIYGYDSPADLIIHLDDIASGLYLDPRRRDEFTARMQADGVVNDFESQVRHRNGSVIWISESARAVRHTDEDVFYYEGLVKDITERKVLEAEREQLLAEAIARADHDPLTGLLNHRAFHARFEDESDRALQNGKPLTIALLDLDNFGFFNDVYGHAVGDDVLRRVASVLRNGSRGADVVARFAGDEFAMLLPDTSGAEAAALMSGCLGHLAEIGYRPPGYDCVVPLNLSLGLAVLPDDGQTRQDALLTAETRLLHVKTGGEGDAPAAQLRETMTHTVEGFSMLDALVTAVDNKDRYTRRHSEDVMVYSLAIGRELGLAEEDLRHLQTAALLHDVGKIGVPDRILRKPGHLTEEEFEAIRQHPVMGAAIVAAVPGFELTLDAVRYHHERWDGQGYPEGLRENATPLAARIMAVADAYSAMTTNRPYRKGMQAQQALAILEDGAGTQWDPHCVRAFLRTRARGSNNVHLRAA